MPALNITLKENANPEELNKAKRSVKDQGGKVTKEFTLIKGFTAEFPANSVHTLASNDHIHVEADEEVTIQ